MEVMEPSFVCFLLYLIHTLGLSFFFEIFPAVLGLLQLAKFCGIENDDIHEYEEWPSHCRIVRLDDIPRQRKIPLGPQPFPISHSCPLSWPVEFDPTSTMPWNLPQAIY